MMKLLLLLILISGTQSFAQMTDDYPERDPALESEFNPQPALPQSDYEEVPREEQEYAPESGEELPPEEVYEADEEYLE